MKKYRIRMQHPSQGEIVQDLYGASPMDALMNVEIVNHWLTQWLKIGKSPWFVHDRISGVTITATVRALPR